MAPRDSETLAEVVKAVLRALPCTRREATQRLGISRFWTEKAFNKLVANGTIVAVRRVGPEIIKQGSIVEYRMVRPEDAPPPSAPNPLSGVWVSGLPRMREAEFYGAWREGYLQSEVLDRVLGPAPRTEGQGTIENRRFYLPLSGREGFPGEDGDEALFD